MLVMKRPFLTILIFSYEVILLVIAEFRSYFEFRLIYSSSINLLNSCNSIRDYTSCQSSCFCKVNPMRFNSLCSFSNM